MIVVRDREAGNIIEEVATIEEGLKLIEEYEEQDKKDGIYEEDFYDVAELTMTPSELLKNNYNELTEEARNVIATSDQSFDEWAGEFESAAAFNEFVKENYAKD